MAAELHLLNRARVPRSVTDLARNVHVGQEVHLDLDDPVALARLAPPALHVEAESARLVATHLRFGQAREQLAHVCEHPRVSRWVRSRRSPDPRLVTVDPLVEI